MGLENPTVGEEHLKEFLAEAEEIVESLNADLLSLASGEKTDASLLNSIFRSAHSLKGLSGMFGFEAMSTLSHNLENLLDSLRLGKIEVSPVVIDILLEAVSVLHNLLEMKSQGKSDINIEGMVGKLNKTIQDYGKGSAAQTNDLGIEEAIMNVLTEYEEYRLTSSIKAGLNIFKIQASFPIMSFDQGLADLTNILKDQGEIITTLPTPGSSPGDSINFDIVVATSQDSAFLEKAIDNKDIKIMNALKRSGTASSAAPLPVSRGESTPEAEEKKGDEGLKSITQTVRVDISKLDNLMNIVGELVLIKSSIEHAAISVKSTEGNSGRGGELLKGIKSLEKRLSELQEGVLDARMIPLGQLFEKLARTVRKLGREVGKEIEYEVKGAETQLDKLIVEDLANPLMHIIRNSIDHGIESPEERRRAGKPEKGSIKVNAYQKGNHVIVEVQDDGKGIDHEKILKKAVEKGIVQKGVSMRKDEIIDLIFLPSFSTKDQVSEISGRGVGMDVVKKNISDLSGMVDIETEKGKGTKISLILPMTLAIIQALVVEVSGNKYAIPLSSVLENFYLNPSEIDTIETREFVYLRDTTLPLVRLYDYFRLGGERGIGKYVVVVGLAERRIGLVVDKLMGQQDIVLKTVGRRLKDVRGIAGATDIGQNTVLVVDIGGIIEECLKGQGNYRYAIS